MLCKDGSRVFIVSQEWDPSLSPPWEFWAGPGWRLLHPHWEGNKLYRHIPRLCFWNCPKWPGSLGKLVWLCVFSALCLVWDLHLVFCASVGVPVLCSILWNHSASYPRCHWAERHGNVPWGLMNINIITNLLESFWISLEFWVKLCPVLSLYRPRNVSVFCSVSI